MNAQTFFKGLFMTLIAVSVTFFSQSPVQWALMAVTVIATILAYTGKNLIAVLTSTTGPGQFSFVNFISALLIALATGITESLALIITEGHIVWLTLGKVVLAVTFTYVGSTLFSPPKSQSPQIKLFTK
jgi:hypothetical protein